MKNIILVAFGALILFFIFKVVFFPPSVIAPSKNLPEDDKIRESNMKITSAAFNNNQPIPIKYTCDGENVNPPLEFSEIPKDAKSLVLIVDDPDVPKDLKPDGVFDHWVVYNIPANTPGIDESAKAPPGLPGRNSGGQFRYTGPCPPDREHRYVFKLYALDKMLEFNNPDNIDKKAVEQSMHGHILEKAELVGLYDRTKH